MAAVNQLKLRAKSAASQPRCPLLRALCSPSSNWAFPDWQGAASSAGSPGWLANASPFAVQVPPKIIDRYVNLLVLGESGLGKTTFIKNCFADLSQEPFELRDASGASMQVGRWPIGTGVMQNESVFLGCACHSCAAGIWACPWTGTRLEGLACPREPLHMLGWMVEMTIKCLIAVHRSRGQQEAWLLCCTSQDG